MKNDGGPAFPRAGFYHEESLAENDSTSQDGMSLRAYLAGQALAGFCGAPSLADTPASDIADWCIETADDLIAKLEAD